MSLFKPFSKIQIWIMGVLFFVFGTAHLKALANVENLWSARIPISLEGTIRPIEIIREQTSVGGRITAITVEENDEVQKNQLLLSLKNDTQKQQLELAQLQQKINQKSIQKSIPYESQIDQTFIFEGLGSQARFRTRFGRLLGAFVRHKMPTWPQLRTQDGANIEQKSM